MRRVCPQCNTVFDASNSSQRRCSRACESATRAAARRGHPPPPPIAGAVWLELGDGAFTLIDEQDAPVLRQHVWHRNQHGYAATTIDGLGKLHLHQFLLPYNQADHVIDSTIVERTCARSRVHKTP